MNIKYKIILLSLALVGIVAVIAEYVRTHTIAVLEPAGVIGRKERSLIIIAVLLSVIVVVPVYVMTIAIALKYRESNHKVKKVTYEPDWDHSRLYEAVWWGIPLVIITILSVITWVSSHELDPFKSLASNKKPLTIQVVALDWKWLFIYPEQHIASVNLVTLPKDTPVDFQITSDSVMNSFWVPQLGSQIYAMPGMSTQLHLMADRTGTFYGSPANIAGKGYAYMTFKVDSVSDSDFDGWVNGVRRSSQMLDSSAYGQLAKQSINNPVAYYSYAADGLYNEVVMKYMEPSSQGTGM